MEKFCGAFFSLSVNEVVKLQEIKADFDRDNLIEKLGKPVIFSQISLASGGNVIFLDPLRHNKYFTLQNVWFIFSAAEENRRQQQALLPVPGQSPHLQLADCDLRVRPHWCQQTQTIKARQLLGWVDNKSYSSISKTKGRLISEFVLI